MRLKQCGSPRQPGTGKTWFRDQVRYKSHHERHWTSAVQLEAMDEEGIDVAVLFGTQIALTVNGLMNKELAAVLCHAVNQWLMEYCSADPKRLLAVG